MPSTDHELWAVLANIELLTGTQKKKVRKEWLDADSDNPQPLAGRLIAQGLLTPFQVALLERYVDTPQRIPPFQYGPFLIVSDLQPPDYLAPHQYRCRLTSQEADQSYRSAQFLLRFAGGTHDRIWEHWESRLKTQPTPHLIQPVASIRQARYRALVEFVPQDSLSGLVAFLGPGNTEIKQEPKVALKIVAGLVSGLSSRHQQSRVCGWISPAQVFVNRNGNGYLRAVPDGLLGNPTFAEQVLGIPPAESQETGPLPVVTTEESRPASRHDFRESLLEPFSMSPTIQWCDADFLAPELYDGSAASPESDLYSIGCLLYLLTHGQLPFGGGTWEEKHQARQSVASIGSDLPKPVAKLLERLLQPEPANRRVSAAKLADSIWGLLKKQPESEAVYAQSESQQQAQQWLDLQDSLTFGESGTTTETDAAGSASAGTTPLAIPNINTQKADPAALSGLSLSTEAQSPARRWQNQKPPSRTPMYVMTSSAAALLLLLVAWGSGWLSSPPDSSDGPLAQQPSRAENAKADSPDVVATQTGYWSQQTIADDGRTLWESPTVGPPNQLPILPAGPFAVGFVQGEFFRQAQTDRLLVSLEGLGSDPPAWLEVLRGLEPESFQRLVFAQYQIENQAYHLLLAQAPNGRAMDLAGWKVVGKLPEAFLSWPEEEESEPLAGQADNTGNAADQKARSQDDQVDPAGNADSAMAKASAQNLAAEENSLPESLVLVRESSGSVQVAIVTAQFANSSDSQSFGVIPVDRMQPEIFDPEYAEGDWPADAKVHQIILTPQELAMDALKQTTVPELTLPLAKALACTDRDRHFQLIINPVAVWNEAGRNWLGPDHQWLAELVKTQVPPETRAAYMALHFDDGQSYAEAKFIIDRTANGQTFLNTILDRLTKAPMTVERTILNVPRLPYWDSALLEFDDMLKTVQQYLRAGQHQQIPTLNVWLPDEAPSNLVAELNLYFTAAKYAGETQVAGTTQNQPPADLDTLLVTNRTFKIIEQDLVNALAELQQDIRDDYPDLPFELELQMDGNSLRTAGITQNQKITNFELTNQPLAEILTALVLKANPDPAVTDPKDPGCKLIWLPHPDQPGAILITTRTAAADAGWTLPPQVAVESE